jgi:hypothetical protein
METMGPFKSVCLGNFTILTKNTLKTDALRWFCPIRKFLAIWFAAHPPIDFEYWRE